VRHDEAYPRLAELVGVRAAEVDESALRRHVSSCAGCATRLRELERVERILQSAHSDRRHLPSERLAERVLAIPALNAPELVRPPSRRRVLVLSGAFALPALAVAIWQAASLWPAARPTAGFQPAHRLTLKATVPRLEAELTIGEPTGAAQPLRLVAEGFPTGGAGSYALWLVGPDGSEMVRAFQPNGEGSCAIDAAAPAGHWTQVAITRGNQSPTPGHTVATGSL
jgi:hypothetical protein